jgi:hypothetical protein
LTVSLAYPRDNYFYLPSLSLEEGGTGQHPVRPTGRKIILQETLILEAENTFTGMVSEVSPRLKLNLSEK